MGDEQDIDLTAIEHVTSLGGTDLLAHLVGLFAEMGPKRLESVRNSLEIDDAESIRRELHGFRSGAGNLGAMKLMHTASAIEAHAKDGDLATIASMYEILEFHYTGAQTELERILGRLREGSTVEIERELRQQKKLKGATIAVVEDNPDNRLLVRAMLEEFYTVVDYEDGKSAIDGVTSNPPDLILMDISLPEMDGIEILSKLREDDVFAKIPAIALTAFAMEGDRERFLNSGFDEYVSKPVEEDVLLKTIDSLLKKN